MATIQISNTPTSLDLLNFRAIVDKYKGPARSCRFIARILPVGQFLTGYGGFMQDLSYLCEAAEYPGRGFQNVDVRYYGPNQKLPFLSSYEDITMTFICRNGSREREFFDDWQTIINPVNTFDFNYRDDYAAQIEIFQLDDQAVGQYKFVLHNAYPVIVNPQPLTWADDQFLRLGVTFTYSWWTRPGLDPESRTSGTGGSSFNLTKNQVF